MTNMKKIIEKLASKATLIEEHEEMKPIIFSKINYESEYLKEHFEKEYKALIKALGKSPEVSNSMLKELKEEYEAKLKNVAELFFLKGYYTEKITFFDRATILLKKVIIP